MREYYMFLTTEPISLAPNPWLLRSDHYLELCQWPMSIVSLFWLFIPFYPSSSSALYPLPPSLLLPLLIVRLWSPPEILHLPLPAIATVTVGTTEWDAPFVAVQFSPLPLPQVLMQP